MLFEPRVASLLSEQAVQHNLVTDVRVTDSMILVYLKPKLVARYQRPDCQAPVAVQRYARETIVVQGLGVQGKAWRYVVETVRLAYLNDAGRLVTFTAPLPGIRTDLLVTDEVVDRARRAPSGEARRGGLSSTSTCATSSPRRPQARRVSLAGGWPKRARSPRPWPRKDGYPWMSK